MISEEEYEEWKRWQSVLYCLNMVKKAAWMFQFVRQTEEICIAAARCNGMVLELVENQTEEICKAAVKQNPYALVHVKNQTEAICLEAVQQNGLVLEYVHDQTEEICKAAVKQNPDALRCIFDCEMREKLYYGAPLFNRRVVKEDEEEAPRRLWQLKKRWRKR